MLRILAELNEERLLGLASLASWMPLGLWLATKKDFFGEKNRKTRTLSKKAKPTRNTVAQPQALAPSPSEV